MNLYRNKSHCMDAFRQCWAPALARQGSHARSARRAAADMVRLTDKDLGMIVGLEIPDRCSSHNSFLTAQFLSTVIVSHLQPKLWATAAPSSTVRLRPHISSHHSARSAKLRESQEPWYELPHRHLFPESGS